MRLPILLPPLFAMLMMGNAVAQESATDLTGTVWLEPDRNRNGEYLWRFESDGVVKREAANQPAVRGQRGTWRLSGLGLYTEFGNRSYEFRGTWSNDTITGSTIASGQMSEALVLQRLRDPPEPLTMDEYEWRKLHGKNFPATVDDYIEYAKFHSKSPHRAEAVAQIDQWVRAALADARAWSDPQAGGSNYTGKWGRLAMGLAVAAYFLEDQSTIKALAERSLRENDGFVQAGVTHVLQDERLLAQIAIGHQRVGNFTGARFALPRKNTRDIQEDMTTVLAASKISDEDLLGQIVIANHELDLASSLAALYRLTGVSKLSELERSLANVKQDRGRFVRQLVAFRRMFYSNIVQKHPDAKLEMVTNSFPVKSYQHTYKNEAAQIDGIELAIAVHVPGKASYTTKVATVFPGQISEDKLQKVSDNFSALWLAPPFEPGSMVRNVQSWLGDGG